VRRRSRYSDITAASVGEEEASMKRRAHVPSARHRQAARDLAAPQPGFFRVRETSGGPWIAARIYRGCPIEMPIDAPWQWLDRWPPLVADIDGRDVPPEKIWSSGEPITLAEWLYLTEAAAWERQYAPAAPPANPRQRVDLPFVEVGENSHPARILISDFDING